MLRISILILTILWMMPLALLQGQQVKAPPEPSEGIGLDSKTSKLIQRRWLGSQPVIIVLTEDGKQNTGQPIHAAKDTLYLLASSDLPLGFELSKKVHSIPYVNVDRVLIQKGGNQITRSRKAVSHQIPVENKYFTDGFQALKKAAIYPDTLLFPTLMDEAFVHSPVLRQVFPRKKFRFSVSAGVGGKGVLDEAREALQSSTLPPPESGYESSSSMEVVDVSWRFLNHFIVGGQLSARNTSSTIYTYNHSPTWSNSYHYDVHYFEHRLYAEYVFFPVNRYFTKRWELLAGAGVLIGKPELMLFYSYDEYSDPENSVYETVEHRQSDPLMGFQLRAAFHFYLFPGFSLWSGLEGNFSSPWTIQEVEFRSNNPLSPLVLQEHTLDFTSVRFKFGVSIYL